MNPELNRKALISAYHAYVSTLERRGIVFDVLPDSELEKIPMDDLTRVLRLIRDVARTPETA